MTQMKSLYFTLIACTFIVVGCLMDASAQVCTGSLGDPIVNINFGLGSNPGNSLNAATTSYTFTSSTCPNDGSYTIVSSTANCFSNSWHTIAEDHSPNDVNGYMMLVNASNNPGDFYVDTVKGLCANTKYELGAWIVNVIQPTSCNNNSNSPNLIFNIETTTGTILGTYTTGNIIPTNSPTWKQYGLFFTTPLTTSTVVIRITNTAPGGCGNDLALDDITFRPCGPTINAAGPINNQTVFDFCKGAPTNVSILADIGSGYLSPSLQWQFSSDNGINWSDIVGETFTSYRFTQTALGIYKYRMSVADGSNIAIKSCRVVSNTVTFSIYDLPFATASSNSPVCEKRPIELIATGGATYSWAGPANFNSSLATPSLIAQSNSGGQYTVTAINQYGCTNSTFVNVLVKPKPIVTISGTQKICEGDAVTLQAGGGVTYQWSPAAGLSAVNIANPIARPADTTSYQVIITGLNNCSDTAIAIMNVVKKPTAFAGPDKSLLIGQSTQLNGLVGGTAISFTWLPVTFLNNPLLDQPTSSPLDDILYTLHVKSNDGCGEATDDVFIKVYKEIYVPSAFSPNNDGLNDRWRILALITFPNAILMVYNRYGEIVFEGSGNNMEWDGSFKGKPAPMGAYTYLIDFKNGTPLKKGMVSILR
jgi:gliding motility-associated-like protein